jgi:hypothetical protein
VLTSYQDQFVRLMHFDRAPFASPLERLRDGNSLVLHASVSQGSDYILDVTAFVREGQPWALLETCLR